MPMPHAHPDTSDTSSQILHSPASNSSLLATLSILTLTLFTFHSPLFILHFPVSKVAHRKLLIQFSMSFSTLNQRQRSGHFQPPFVTQTHFLSPRLFSFSSLTHFLAHTVRLTRITALLHWVTTRTTSEKTGRWTTHRWLYTATRRREFDAVLFSVFLFFSHFLLSFLLPSLLYFLLSSSPLAGHGQFKGRADWTSKKRCPSGGNEWLLSEAKDTHANVDADEGERERERMKGFAIYPLPFHLLYSFPCMTKYIEASVYRHMEKTGICLCILISISQAGSHFSLLNAILTSLLMPLVHQFY